MRTAARLLTYASLLALAAFLSFLPFAGRYLVVEDPLAKADAIVVLAGTRAERWLEAVDLYHEGWAPRIVLSRGRVEPAEIALRAMLAAQGWRRVIVVTSKYHTRRTKFAFERELGGTGTEVIVRGTRQDGIAPARWWTVRSEIRWVTSELQRLIAYRLGLAD